MMIKRRKEKADAESKASTNGSSSSEVVADGETGFANFAIETEWLGEDLYVIALSGEVDLFTAPEFKKRLLEAIGRGAKEVVVDLTNTTFIDSTTLGVLVGGIRRLRPNNGRLTLVFESRNIMKIFEITGLDRVFTIYPTREEAIEAVGASIPPVA